MTATEWEYDWSQEMGDDEPPYPDDLPILPDVVDERPPLGSDATPFIAGFGYAERFPTHVLPAPMRHYVHDLAVRKQVPVDLPALTMLGILGSVAGPRITIRRDLDWRQPLNLYTICALSSGSAKSPVVGELRDGLWKARILLEDKHERDLALLMAQMERDIDDKRNAANATTDGFDTRDLLRAEANKLEARLEELRKNPPAAPDLFFDGDTTPEALGQSMAANQGVGAVIDDEGTFLRNLGGQYSGGKTGNLSLVLVGYDCRFYKPKRTGRVADPIHRAALSLVISPQPGIVADMMRNSTMDELGFVNRFLVCIPGDLIGQREDRPSTYFRDAPQQRDDKAGRLWWSDLLTRVAEYDIIGNTDEDDAATIDLSREAWQRHRQYETHIERRMHPTGGDLRKVSAWATKHCARVLRVAGLLHLAHGLTTDDDMPVEVMEEAIAIGDWSIKHFTHAGSVVGLSEGAGRIKEYIDGTEQGFAARTTLYAEVFKKHEPSARISQWIEELVATGEYRLEKMATTGRAKEVLRRVVAQ